MSPHKLVADGLPVGGRLGFLCSRTAGIQFPPTKASTDGPQGVSIMTVLLIGAGTDYWLFLVAHYRERLCEVKDKFTAIHEAGERRAPLP